MNAFDELGEGLPPFINLGPLYVPVGEVPGWARAELFAILDDWRHAKNPFPWEIAARMIVAHADAPRAENTLTGESRGRLGLDPQR